MPVLFASFWTGLLMTVFMITGIFLILLVLIQRGRGGGLVGALGGVGGSSPFGSRAGDLFTRITLAVAAFWIVSAMFIACTIQTKRPDRTANTISDPNAPATTTAPAPEEPEPQP